MREPNTRDRGSLEVLRGRVARRGFEPLTSSLKGNGWRKAPYAHGGSESFRNNDELTRRTDQTVRQKSVLEKRGLLLRRAAGWLKLLRDANRSFA